MKNIFVILALSAAALFMSACATKKGDCCGSCGAKSACCGSCGGSACKN